MNAQKYATFLAIKEIQIKKIFLTPIKNGYNQEKSNKFWQGCGV
jgi:hypothetical protein